MIEVILYSTITILILTAYWWNENKSRFVMPTNEASWIPNHIMLATIIDQNNEFITVHNVRDTYYKSKKIYTPKYFDKAFMLNDIVRAEFHTSNKRGMTIHVFITFIFKDGTEVAISVKPRRRKSLPKHFIELSLILNPQEIIYTIATKRDIFTWRTEELHEKIKSYNLELTNEQLKKLFKGLVNKADGNAKKPAFYSIISNNCFTTIFNSINTIASHRLPVHHYSYTFSPLLDDMLLKRGLISKVKN